jgi:hypothetical protein
MNKQPPIETPTVSQHKRQFFWQILLPMLLIVLIGLAAGGLVAWATFSGRGGTRLWADVSLIWLLTPVLVLALALAIVLGFVIYGLARLEKATPRFTSRVQELADIGARGVRQAADGATKPFVWMEQGAAALRSAIMFLLEKK